MVFPFSILLNEPDVISHFSYISICERLSSFLLCLIRSPILIIFKFIVSHSLHIEKIVFLKNGTNLSIVKIYVPLA